MAAITNYRVQDNHGAIKRESRWLCTHVDNFCIVDGGHLLEKCFPRACKLLVDLHSISKKERTVYIKLLHSKRNGVWIDKTRPQRKPACENADVSPHTTPHFGAEVSGHRSETVMVSCSLCFHAVEVPRSQLLVFCPNCDIQYTNEYALEED